MTTNQTSHGASVVLTIFSTRFRTAKNPSQNFGKKCDPHRRKNRRQKNRQSLAGLPLFYRPGMVHALPYTSSNRD